MSKRFAAGITAILVKFDGGIDDAVCIKTAMNLSEFLEVLWRRKLIVLAVVLISLGVAVGALRLATKQYEAKSTMAVLPSGTNESSIFILGVIDQLTPLYADVATAPDTLAKAQLLLPAGMQLADIRVQTYQGTSLINIFARDPKPLVAQQSAQAVSRALLEREQEGTVKVGQVRLEQFSRAQLPSDPVFPRPTLTLAVALLLGLGFGVGAALLRENLTTKVETPEALARITGVPSYAEIPNEPALARVSAAQDFADPKFRIVSEALRDLRTNLLFTKGNLRSIVVTSPEGSHGKTTVSFGLAVSFARSGARTLLVDADLRKGRVSELLNVQRTPGLSEILRGHPVETAIRHTSLENLDFLTGGLLGEDPGELLMAEFPNLLHQFERTYDMVVIDTTPLVPVSDARIIARFGKATLIVASAGSTTRRQLKTAVERLQLISVQPTGAVLNNYRAASKTAYYGPAESTNGSKKSGKSRRLARL
jgi:succinoglycan biosynthesis transport protein ExoP